MGRANPKTVMMIDGSQLGKKSKDPLVCFRYKTHIRESTDTHPHTYGQIRETVVRNCSSSQLEDALPVVVRWGGTGVQRNEENEITRTKTYFPTSRNWVTDV